MLKNLFLLCLLTWIGYSYAMHPVVQENMGDAESYKVEEPVEEQEAQRSVAGAKIKKKKQSEQEWPEQDDSFKTDPDSEVRYWEYSE